MMIIKTLYIYGNRLRVRMLCSAIDVLIPSIKELEGGGVYPFWCPPQRRGRVDIVV